MKLKHIISGIVLSCSMVFGTGVALSKGNGKALKTEAVSYNTWGDNMYFRGQAGGNLWPAWQFTSLYTNYLVQKVTITSDTREFKLTKDNDWSDNTNQFNSNTYSSFSTSLKNNVSTTQGGNLSFNNAGTYVFYWQKNKSSDVYNDVDLYTCKSNSGWSNAFVVGAFEESGWSTFVQLTESGVSGVFEATMTVRSANTGFKITSAQNYTTQLNNGDKPGFLNLGSDSLLSFVDDQGNIIIKEPGIYKISWTKNSHPENIAEDFNITKTGDIVPEPHTYDLGGSFTDPSWTISDDTYRFEQNVAGDTATFTTRLESSDEFKIGQDGNFNVSYGYSDLTLDATATGKITEGSDNNAVIGTAGFYTFEIDIDTSNYSVNSITVSFTADVYSVVFGGQRTTLSPTDAGDYKAQWIGTVSVTAGQTPTFNINTTGSLTVNPDTVSNNNVFLENGTVLQTASNVAIYLKLDNSDHFTYWLAGRTSTYFAYVGTTIVPMSENPYKAGQYMATSVSVALNDTIRFYYTDLFDANIEGYASGSWSVVGGKVTAGEAGTFNIYMTPSLGNNQVYFDTLSDADRAAVAYAETFLNTLQANEDPICIDERVGPGKTSLSRLQTAWSSLKGTYNAISVPGAKQVLQDASVVGASKVNQFAALYDHIVKAYNSQLGEGYNFVGRSIGGLSNALTPFSNSGEQTTMIIVVSISVLAITATGLFFFLRKKKEN